MGSQIGTGERLIGGVFSLGLLFVVYACLRGGTPIVAIVFFLPAAAFAGVAVGLSRWSSAAWAVRLALVFLAYIVWKGRASWHFIDWMVWSGLAVAGLVAQYVAHRHALGWITDSRGERQKVDFWNRGSAIFKPTTRGQRVVREAELKSSRRLTLLWSTPVAWGLVYFAFRLYKPGEWGGTFAVGFFALLMMLVWVPAAITEILYLFGYQDMEGHKVLDDTPTRPGAERVGKQKAHGDAPLASEEEAQSILNRRR